MLAQQLGVSPQDLATQIQDRIDSAYDASNVDSFLRSFADCYEARLMMGDTTG